jgi:hypothetical protein
MTDPTLPTVEIVAEESQLWGTGLQPAGCPVCGAGFLISAQPGEQRCPNCWRSNLQAQPARLRPEPPELVIPFPQKGQDYLTQAQNFVKPVWLRPDDLEPACLIQRAVPVFLPHWLVDGNLSGNWQAQVGYDYQVQSSQETYGGSGWQTHQVVETRIRWESRLGQIARRYENLPAPACSESAQLAKRIGQSSPKEGWPYQPDLLHNAVLRIPDMPPESAWPAARTQFNQHAAQDCQTAAAGQHIDQFSLNAEYKALNWTQLLQPYYATAYQDDEGRLHTILINPFSGALSGPRLASTRKAWLYSAISAGIAILLLILGAVLLASAGLAPPLSVLGALAIIGGLAAGIFALAPVLWVWNWNRQQIIIPIKKQASA